MNQSSEHAAVAAPECDITFFVACYNEEANIVAALTNVVNATKEVGCSYDIVVIDDASKDRSVELIKQYMDAHPDVPLKLLVNASNQGLGANYAEGCFHGNGKYYRLICGDNEERYETIVAVLKHLGQADMILSYHVDRSARSWHRRVVSSSFTGLVNLVTGYRIKYYNGLPIIRRYDVMRWHSHAHGFGFQADTITRMLDLGATYVEVPVVPTERTEGKTKAFTMRNFCSVGHTLLEIFIRRAAKLAYPKHVGRLSSAPTMYQTAGFDRR